MRDALAERLLAGVMDWSPGDVARERQRLQAMAAYKYDEYQQFAPGRRFVESLALWLSQFSRGAERRAAYEFVLTRLVYYSAAEMNHFVSLAYPDHIRPILLNRTAHDANIPGWQVAKLAQSKEFRCHRRRTLFLGLSDGARIDFFRRSNPELSHEQVRQTYEIPEDRAADLLSKLADDLHELGEPRKTVGDQRFSTVVLLDDFSGSGTSYLRWEGEHPSGKVGKFHQSLITKRSALSQVTELEHIHIILVLYLATDQAIAYLQESLNKLWSPVGIGFDLVVVSSIPKMVKVRAERDAEFEKLIDKYYDPSIEDEHSEKGGTDLKHGFAGCSLPVVLNHNTPNNSVSLLWAHTDRVRPLFPRISRHK